MAQFPTSPDGDSTKDVVKLVKSGKVDLAELTAAMRFVIENGGAVVQWEIDCSQVAALSVDGNLGELVIRPGELKLAEQCDIVDRTGIGWDGFNPQTDPRHARALLATVVQHRNPDIGGDYSKAEVIVGDITTDEFDAAFRIVEQRPADPT